MKTKLLAAFVIGFDGNDHVIYRDGEVVYKDDRIEFVGHGYDQPVDHTIDAGMAI
ncbi:MAG: 5-methylthioadenosine/S-adenosylhomocysteine deaminase, partial [Candidatus Promineifilaceae bacterium]